MNIRGAGNCIYIRTLYLQVGGIKEKILAAHRAGIRHVIMPRKNEKDLREIPANVQVCNFCCFLSLVLICISPSQAELEFIFASTIDDVLQHAFDMGMKPSVTSKL